MDTRGKPCPFWEKEGMNWIRKAQAMSGDGDCMQAAAQLMMRWKHSFWEGGRWDPGGTPTLVHALVWGKGPASGYRFPHAWVEVSDTVYDNSGGKERKVNKVLYYLLGAVTPEEEGAYQRYSYRQMADKLMASGHYGPWDLDDGLERQPSSEEDDSGEYDLWPEDELDGDDEGGDRDGSGGERFKGAGSGGMTLGDLIDMKVGMEGADFWMVRRGTPDEVGRPVREWGPERVGVKVVRTDILLPSYLFYVLEHIHGSGYFRGLARGSTRLVGIRLSDIAEIKVGAR
jgi:hypothetical protein